MKKQLNTILMAGAVSLSVLLAACGAENISLSSSQAPQVKGVAASGAPVIGTVTLKDASVPARVRTTTSAANGSFLFNVNGLTPPFVLTVTWTDSGGANQLYSLGERPGTVNINPFSNAAFAAAAEADPSTLAVDPDPALIRACSGRHRSVIGKLRQKLASLFALYGTNQNPVDDEYEADHTGLDAMFDDVKITVSYGMITVTNKETHAVIFTAPMNNIDAGIFYPENMPGQPGQVNGTSLYTTYCSSCHGPLATSSKRGVTAAQIQSAIHHVDAMDSDSLSRLTAVQVQAIASVLSSTVTSTPTPTTPPTIDGAALYTTDCSSCHGPLATSSKRGATATAIQSAIQGVGAMSQLSTLSTAQTQAIAAALSSTPTPTPAPVACTYTYDVWGACQSNNTQTRNLLTSSPAGCTGTPVLSQPCTYVPPTPAACTYTYDVWGACQSNNTQTRNVLTSTPSGCTGTPVTSQACTYVPPACTYTYSDWGACQSNSTQTRNLLTSSPAGCIGTPVLSQSCTYVPPVLDGAALYTQYCSGCHGNAKKGKSVSAIQSAISSNRGGMGSLSNLTADQIAAISTAP